MASLFGPTPEELMAAQQRQQEQDILAQGQEFGMFRPLYQAGLRFGQAGQNAITQGLFPEAQDPAIRKAQATQAILNKYQGQNLSDPLVLRQIGSEFLSAGVPEAGIKALTLSKELTPDSPFAKIDPTKFTPESLKKYAKSRDVGDLESISKESFTILSPSESKALNLDPNKSYQKNDKTGEIKQIGTSAAVVFNAPLTGSENEYAKVVGKAKGEQDTALVSAAATARDNIAKIDTTLNELSTGNQITGIGSDVLLNIERLKAQFLNDKKAGKKVTDTQYLDALLGQDVFPMIGSLGIGARGLDTPAEREFLRSVMTGSISLDKDTIVRLTKMRRDIAQRAIEKYNKKVESGELDNYFKLTSTPKTTINIEPWNPPKKPQAGAQGWSIIGVTPR